MTDVSWHRIPALNDNYIWLIEDRASARNIVIDPTTSEAVLDFLENRSIELTDILLTHHHRDHIGGVKGLLKQYDAHVYGSRKDKRRLPDLDSELSDGDLVNIGTLQFHVKEIDGHTMGHILYQEPKMGWVFVGDTLFALGCGRMFEGTPELFVASLDKIKKMNPNTLVFCAHEYTLSNAQFAIHVDPKNQDLISRINEIERLRSNDEATVPFELRADLATNPFLRLNDPSIRSYTGVTSKNEAEVFGKLRAAKDTF